MLEGIKRFKRQWGQWKDFKAIEPGDRPIVIYSEGAGYWTHFEPIVRHLFADYPHQLVYLTSDENDPVLADPLPGIRAFYIGSGSVRTMLFASLEAKVVVMTMPDLQTYYIKRSPQVGHYVYIHHSMASCHMIYKEQAFDHFDSIFCVGPHHVKEIRAREKQAGLPAKNLVQHGYGRLDLMLEKISHMGRRPACPKDLRGRVLIAPSWGENSLLERTGGDFIGPLLEDGYQVTLRPHPQTKKLYPGVVESLLANYGAHKYFFLDENMDSMQSLFEADVMISDWSGAAIEFAFAFERPVLFIDVPRKVNNPRYDALSIEPIEAEIRNRVGRVLAETELNKVPETVETLINGEINRGKLIAEREKWVFNVGESGQTGARELAMLAGL